jgi:hypothetical protein
MPRAAAPAVESHRLPIVAPLPCSSCDERVQAGPERRRLSQQFRLLKRRDFERPLRGPCALPCALLETRLDPSNPCKGCFHRDKRTCTSACHVLEKLLPRAVPTYYDEVPVKDAVLEVRAPEAEESKLDESRWCWANVADELRFDLERAIQERLTEKQRQAILMHLDGMAGVAIAKAMGVSKVTAFWFVVRAKRRIAEFFEKSPDAHRRVEAALARTHSAAGQ